MSNSKKTTSCKELVLNVVARRKKTFPTIPEIYELVSKRTDRYPYSTVRRRVVELCQEGVMENTIGIRGLEGRYRVVA